MANGEKVRRGLGGRGPGYAYGLTLQHLHSRESFWSVKELVRKRNNKAGRQHPLQTLIAPTSK